MGVAIYPVRISLPARVRAIVEAQIAKGLFSSVSEYVCRLIEDDERRRCQAETESLLVARVTGSEAAVKMNSADWKQMRDKFHRRVTTGGGR